MGRESADDSIEVLAGDLKEAATALDDVQQGGIDIGELARDGLSKMLRRSMTDEDRIAIVERYQAGGLSEDAAQVLLRDELDLLEGDIDEFGEAVEYETSQYLARKSP